MNGDCVQQVCTAMVCAAASCTDGVRNGSESDVDCGGSCTAKCAVGEKCVIPADCVSNSCSSGTCGGSAFLCSDHIKNQDETDVDCGGTHCAPCANGLACLLPRDCSLGFCDGSVCGNGFGAATGPTGPPVHVDMVLAQMNPGADAFLDMAAVESNGGANNQVGVLFGDGTPNFATPTLTTLPTGGWSWIGVGDFNSDSKPDVVVARHSSTPNLTLLKGNGNGTFQASQTFTVTPAGTYPNALLVGFFDSDANPDLAVTYNGTSVGVAISLGDGAGGFGAPTQIDLSGRMPVTTNCNNIIAADVNGDGTSKIDLIVDCTPNQIWILIGAGNGTFAVASGVPTVMSEPKAIATALVDGDSYVDLVAGNASNAQVSLLRGNGNGTFGSPTNFATGGNVNCVSAADLNGDGFTDILVTTVTTMEILLGDGTGSFAAGPTFYPVNAFKTQLVDLNGDGKKDIISVGGGGGYQIRLRQ
jgi:hypothetical protein